MYEKLQYDSNKEAWKISGFSFRKTNKYSYVKEALLSEESGTIAQAKLTYSPFGKAFEIQTKNTE